jgi:hypothetical protein
MRTVSAGSVAAGQERMEELPASVQEALGGLAGAAKEGLLALSVGVGLGVLHELMEAEVDEVVGPKGRHDPARVRAPRTASTRSSWARTRTSRRATGSAT